MSGVMATKATTPKASNQNGAAQGLAGPHGEGQQKSRCHGAAGHAAGVKGDAGEHGGHGEAQSHGQDVAWQNHCE